LCGRASATPGLGHLARSWHFARRTLGARRRHVRADRRPRRIEYGRYLLANSPSRVLGEGCHNHSRLRVSGAAWSPAISPFSLRYRVSRLVALAVDIPGWADLGRCGDAGPSTPGRSVSAGGLWSAGWHARQKRSSGVSLGLAGGKGPRRPARQSAPAHCLPDALRGEQRHAMRQCAARRRSSVVSAQDRRIEGEQQRLDAQ
jgi:hypothetical protein